MTQTITPNTDPRYSVLFVEHDDLGRPVRLIEEPVTAWLNETGEDGTPLRVSPLHPSIDLPGARHLKRPTGDLRRVDNGAVFTPGALIAHCRKVGIGSGDMFLLTPADWRSWIAD